MPGVKLQKKHALQVRGVSAMIIVIGNGWLFIIAFIPSDVDYYLMKLKPRTQVYMDLLSFCSVSMSQTTDVLHC